MITDQQITQVISSISKIPYISTNDKIVSISRQQSPEGTWHRSWLCLRSQRQTLPRCIEDKMLRNCPSQYWQSEVVKWTTQNINCLLSFSLNYFKENASIVTYLVFFLLLCFTVKSGRLQPYVFRCLCVSAYVWMCLFVCANVFQGKDILGRVYVCVMFSAAELFVSFFALSGTPSMAGCRRFWSNWIISIPKRHSARSWNWIELE